MLPEKTLMAYAPSLPGETDGITVFDYPLSDLFEWFLLWIAKLSISAWVTVLFIIYLLTGKLSPVVVMLLMLLCVVSVSLSMVFLLD